MRRERAAGRIRRGMRGREMDGVNYFTRVFRDVGDDDDVKTDGAGVESEKTDLYVCVCVLPTAQKKKWEKQALTSRGLPVRIPMHVKTNDKVIVIAGADKGKVTNVVEVFTKTGEVLCKDVNVKTKHVKPRGEGETGQIIQREFPIHHSNVMHYSEEQKVRSRIGTKEQDGKKVRVLRKTGEVLAN